jgi:hypothetical protein
MYINTVKGLTKVCDKVRFSYSKREIAKIKKNKIYLCIKGEEYDIESIRKINIIYNIFGKDKQLPLSCLKEYYTGIITIVYSNSEIVNQIQLNIDKGCYIINNHEYPISFNIISLDYKLPLIRQLDMSLFE